MQKDWEDFLGLLGPFWGSSPNPGGLLTLHNTPESPGLGWLVADACVELVYSCSIFAKLIELQYHDFSDCDHLINFGGDILIDDG